MNIWLKDMCLIEAKKIIFIYKALLLKMDNTGFFQNTL